MSLSDALARGQVLGTWVMVGRHDATRADHGAADHLVGIQARLCAAPQVRARLDALAATGATAEYPAEVERLSADLDGHLHPAEVHGLVEQVRAGREPRPAVVLHTGYERGRARARTDAVLTAGVASLAARAGGASAAYADALAADALGGAALNFTPEYVCKVRQRLRQTTRHAHHDALDLRWQRVCDALAPTAP